MNIENTYEDFGGNIQITYKNGALRQAKRVISDHSNPEIYEKLVCQLKSNEDDVDPVLFFNIKDRKFDEEKAIVTHRENIREAAILMFGFALGGFVVLILLTCRL